jgi:acetyl-CoA C-acetyltransferase
MANRYVVICAPVRTAIGTYNGSLKSKPATSLGAIAIGEVLRRSKVDPAMLGSVIMGMLSRLETR